MTPVDFRAVLTLNGLAWIAAFAAVFAVAAVI